MSELDVSVERLNEYSDADAAGIGRLMPFLSENLSAEPMDEDVLRDIISSPYHDQLVARLDGIIVGTATMNLLMGPAVERKGNLQDFVADPDIRRRGIGDKIWGSMLEWCAEHKANVGLEFTSKASRVEAHSFYKKHGAEVRDTIVFEVEAK
jgi:GNAT superfamily N-acetyltransferase